MFGVTKMLNLDYVNGFTIYTRFDILSRIPKLGKWNFRRLDLEYKMIMMI